MRLSDVNQLSYKDSLEKMERIEKSYEQLLKGEDDIQKAQKNLNLNQKSFNEKDNMNSSIKLSSI